MRIAVAGCGPAGLAAALLLARDGHEVRLFERFDTPRPLGSGLMIQPTGRAVLRAMGLDRAIIAAGARIERLFGQSAGRTVLDVRYAALNPRYFGIGIHRAALFEVLHGAVLAAGIPIATNHTVTGSETVTGRRRLHFAGRMPEDFELVVDALGTSSPLAPTAGRLLAYGALWGTLDWPEGAGFDRAALEQRYLAARRMAGVLPLGHDRLALFWSLRTDRLARWRADGLAAWKAEMAALWPATGVLLEQIDDPARLTFARYAHRTLARPVEPGLVHIGDSWHSASPQLGQGANMALLDAYALALALRRGGDMARLRRRHVRLYQAMSVLFTPVYQSDGWALPVLRDWLAGPVFRLWPATRLLPAMVSGLIGAPLHALGLSVPDDSR
jgi:2-polyprenyl-6-methoxyphenol hydroxylase-like FAD-dependent oxidoreductase